MKLFEAKVGDKIEMNNYFQECRLSQVPEGVNKRLNEDINAEEIFEAINALKMDKSLGSDGLTAIFFKKNM